jgi:phage terminase large subunit-like protein
MPTLRSSLLREARQLPDNQPRRMAFNWQVWAYPHQLPPEGDWTTWLLLGGRGAGKTRAGAEWVRGLAEEGVGPIALVGETMTEAEAVMVRGESGVLRVCPPDRCPKLRENVLIWPNGVEAHVLPAADPERFRGPQFAAAWCDETAKWKKAEAAFDMLQFGLRLGARPRQLVTTTPRATKLMKRLMADEQTVITRAKTKVNKHLADAFMAVVVERYRDTVLGRQELDGELIEDRPDALWQRSMFRAPEGDLDGRIVVAVDPPVTGTARSDACGIVVAGRLGEGAVVLEDALLIGSEMVGLSTVRGAGNSFPFADALVDLAADVRAVVGPETKLTYAADWTEYAGCQGPAGRFFHLDPLWASDDIDAVGIDCYFPLADWRDGEGHADAALAATGQELAYLEGSIAGGEGFDWYYASEADRRAQVRTPITDGAYGEPWVWRFKDIASFWTQEHHDRPGGVRNGAPTAWVPGSKPIWLTEVGCGAIDKGANQPNIFGDEKSAENGRPYFSAGTPDGLIQRQVLRAHHRYWSDPANNPSGMVDPERLYCWTWDARPYPAFPALNDVWSDGVNHRTGHWLTGRLGALASDELCAVIAQEHGSIVEAVPAGPLIGGLTVFGPGTAREVIEPVLDLTGQRLAARAGALVGVAQGPGTAMALDPDELAEIDGPVLTRRRGDASEKPGRLALGHYDRERDYLAATATALRPGNGPVVTQSLPIVLDPAAARIGAERLLDLRASSGDRIEFALPPAMVALEPGDRITLAGVAEGPFEITEIRDGAVRRVTVGPVARGDAVATGIERARGSAGAPMLTMTPVVTVAHLPPLPADAGRSRLVIGAFADPWPGPVRVSDEATGVLVAQLGRPAAIGEVLAPLAPGPVARWDRGPGLEISLRGGHLAEVDAEGVLAGSNRIAVETDSSQWEVIGFATAELIAPGRYRLTRLLRGLEGSEAAIGPISAGRRALVIDQRVATLPVEVHWIGESRSLRFAAGDAAGEVVTAALEPGPALPLSPVHLRAEREASGAIALRWTRRSRADADGWGVAEPALEHVPEAWEVRIFDGTTLVRTITAGSAPAGYGLADQTADFSGAAPAFDFSVRQVSPVFGPGHAAMGAFDG